MERDDQQVGRQCKKPTRLWLSLSVVALRIESFDTLYSGVDQTWTPWYGASCPPQRGQSHRQRLAGELPESLTMMNPSLGAEVADVQLHNAHRSQPASS
jgi:hypothetical protein